MARFVLRRLAGGVATLWAISTLIFAATNLLPGDAARAILGKDATPAAVEKVREGLGLDRPFLVRYGDWLGGVVRFDLGRSLTQGVRVYNNGSFAGGMPVTKVIGPSLANTAVLASVSLALLFGL